MYGFLWVGEGVGIHLKLVFTSILFLNSLAYVSHDAY